MAGLTASACAGSDDRAMEAERLMQTSREWAQAAENRDVEAMLAYWSEDAVVIAPGEPERRGKEEIRGYLRSSFAVPGFSITWEPVSAQVAESGDLAYLLERTQVTVNGPDGRPMSQRFRTVTLWQKEADGRWRARLDLSNAAPRDGL